MKVTLNINLPWNLLFSYCDANYDESRAGHRVGCFKDSVSDRILKGAMVKYRDNNPVKCVR